ncbi:MAG: helix-turn-helix domain-containing protein [Candidatus Cryptobacteroides sp.]
MSKPQHISEVIIKIASNPNDDFGKVLRHCPFIQKELLSRGLISLDDLSDEQIDTLCEQTFLEDWIDGQEVMMKLHISPRTLQTLRSNGTIPYTKIGHKIWYLKSDIERILRTNYIMFKLRDRYGEDD